MNLGRSHDYKYFRSTVAQKKIIVNSDNEEMWTLFDAGPKNVKFPIIFLPPCSGTADIYYRLLLELSSKGYRVISVNYPVIWDHNDWCASFVKLLDKLNIFQVHLFGASLGGFLAQKFAEYTSKRSQMVLSLILCNTFTDTTVFNLKHESKLFWLMPRYYLHNTLTEGMSLTSIDSNIAASVKFIKDKLQQLSQAELASRLTLNCKECSVNPNSLQNLHITIIDVCDENALTTRVNFNLIKSYPTAKRAHMKHGGNFPFISHSSEVTLFILIHFNTFVETSFLPRDESLYQASLANVKDVAVDVTNQSEIAC